MPQYALEANGRNGDSQPSRREIGCRIIPIWATQATWRLLRNQTELPAAPADVGMLPVPLEARIDLTIVAGYLSKTEQHD